MKKFLNLVLVFVWILIMLVVWANFFASVSPLSYFQSVRILIASKLSSETQKTVVERKISNDWLVYDSGWRFGQFGYIERDALGQMWVSAGGLYRYDGEDWYFCKSDALAPLPGGIRALGLSEDKVYVGVSSGQSVGAIGVYDINEKQWTAFWPTTSREQRGAGAQWGSIATDSQGRGYFPTSTGELDIYDGQKWEHTSIPIPRGYECRDLFYRDSLFDQEGNYWLATNLGVWKYDGEEWEVYQFPDPVNAIADDSMGRIWAGTTNGLAVKDVDGQWFYYISERYPFSELEQARIYDVAVDSEDRVWAIAKFHVFVFNGQKWQSFGPDVVGATEWANAIEFDSAGQAWIATEDKGIAVFQGQLDIGPFKKLDTPPPMSDMPDYETEDCTPPDQNDELEILKTIGKYSSLGLVVVFGGVQIVRTVKGK